MFKNQSSKIQIRFTKAEVGLNGRKLGLKEKIHAQMGGNLKFWVWPAPWEIEPCFKIGKKKSKKCMFLHEFSTPYWKSDQNGPSNMHFFERPFLGT